MSDDFINNAGIGIMLILVVIAGGVVAYGTARSWRIYWAVMGGLAAFAIFAICAGVIQRVTS